MYTTWQLFVLRKKECEGRASEVSGKGAPTVTGSSLAVGTGLLSL